LVRGGGESLIQEEGRASDWKGGKQGFGKKRATGSMGYLVSQPAPERDF